MPVAPVILSTTDSITLLAKPINIHIPAMGVPEKPSLRRMKGLEHVYFDGT
jgi:hypothetical protein